MIKDEFMALLDDPERCPNLDRDYPIIEYVYTWHPLNLSKEEAAGLYDSFGVGIFKDMKATAELAELMEGDSKRAREAYDKAAKAYRNLADNYQR